MGGERAAVGTPWVRCPRGASTPNAARSRA